MKVVMLFAKSNFLFYFFYYYYFFFKIDNNNNNNKGGNVIGCSGGSVATNAITKSVAFAASLASYWKTKYQASLMIPFAMIKFTSIIGASSPIFLSVA